MMKNKWPLLLYVVALIFSVFYLSPLVYLFLITFMALAIGFPVAFSLSGAAILSAIIGSLLGEFDFSLLGALPERLYGTMNNETLVAIPLFILMGVTLEKSKVSEDLLRSMAALMAKFKGGLGVSVCLVGALLAASTGIVGATVVTMGLISLPSMMKRGYSAQFASGIICASGTLGQIIPPSIVLIILGDVISSAHQQAQLQQGIFSPTSVSVADLFVGAIGPGLLLVSMYVLYALFAPMLNKNLVSDPRASLRESEASEVTPDEVGKGSLLSAFLPPLMLIVGVLGSILAGVATPTEAASVGCIGAFILAYRVGAFNFEILKSIQLETFKVNAMVFTILIGASIFSLVFRGFGGDEVVKDFLLSLHGGVVISFLIVMLVMFILGFFLDFFEITFVVVPIVGPVLLMMGLDPIWLGVMMAMNLQTSFLTPPFGFSLFYLRGVASKDILTKDIYMGAIPFIIIQIFVMIILWLVPEIVTWLPQMIFK